MDKRRLHVVVYEMEDGKEYAGKVSLGEKYISYSLYFNGSITNNDQNASFHLHTGNLEKMPDLTERQGLMLCRLLCTAARVMYENPLRVKERLLFLKRDSADYRVHSFSFYYSGEDEEVFKVFEK